MSKPVGRVEDQKNGKKITVPTLVMFSKAKLGSGLDVAGIWKDWVEPESILETIGIGNGHGHYLPEEVSGRGFRGNGRFHAEAVRETGLRLP